MGKDANTAAPQTRDNTKRKSTTAGLLAALWPSLLGPEHGEGRRAQNRRIWRRRLTHVALIAAISGISAVAAAPPFHPAGPGDIPHGRGEGERNPRSGLASADGDDEHAAGQGGQHLSIELRNLHGGGAGVSEAVGDHGKDTAQGPEEHSQQPWGPSSSYSPTLAHFAAAGGGGGGGGGGGSGGGGAGGHGGGPSGPSQGEGGPSGDAGAPDQQTNSDLPGAPPATDQPRYVVDPDDGPHEPGDPKWPPKDWPPQTIAPQTLLSPVPEPQTWLMMLGGFAAIGASLRARRRKLPALARAACDLSPSI